MKQKRQTREFAAANESFSAVTPVTERVNAIRVSKQTRRRGFTLIEVLLVLAILGVIAAMVVPQLLGRQKQAMIDQTKLSIKSLENTLEFYAKDHDGEFATSAEGLEVLLHQPNNDDKWHGPYLKDVKTVPLDAWGKPFHYEYPGQHHPQGTAPDITSNGPDKVQGTNDDINNW
jgi:general secretion pathway protein G